MGTIVYAKAGAAVVWWFSAIAGTAAALAVGALAPRITRRTAMQLTTTAESAPAAA
ncbi:hypothetical protein GCM10029978_065540 [Actinoallomurus acanthiterrae]